MDALFRLLIRRNQFLIDCARMCVPFASDDIPQHPRPLPAVSPRGANGDTSLHRDPNRKPGRDRGGSRLHARCPESYLAIEACCYWGSGGGRDGGVNRATNVSTLAQARASSVTVGDAQECSRSARTFSGTVASYLLKRDKRGRTIASFPRPSCLTTMHPIQHEDSADHLAPITRSRAEALISETTRHRHVCGRFTRRR